MIFRYIPIVVLLLLSSCFSKPFDAGNQEPIPVLNGVVDAGYPVGISIGYAFDLNFDNKTFEFDELAIVTITINGVTGDTLSLKPYVSEVNGFSPAFVSSVIAKPGDEVSIHAMFSDGTVATSTVHVPQKDTVNILVSDTTLAPNGVLSFITPFEIEASISEYFQIYYPIGHVWDSINRRRDRLRLLTFSYYDPATDPVDEIANGLFTFNINGKYVYEVYSDFNDVSFAPIDTIRYDIFQLSPASYDYIQYASQFQSDLTGSPFTNLPEFPSNVNNAAGFVIARVPHTFYLTLGQ
jgi:hypothetical protein